MKLPFVKYQATGNDFVLIDNRSGDVHLSLPQIQKICDRKFGIGADGIMLLENHAEGDFYLRYINKDGTQSLCGNGSRAAVAWALQLGMVDRHTRFFAYDGAHEASLLPAGIVQLKMNPVPAIENRLGDIFMDTGSPHTVRFVEDVETAPVVEEGRQVRYSATYAPAGTNVNFVQRLPHNTLRVRTYERGVEDETLSCGTGVTASALAASAMGYRSPVRILTRGGELSVSFQPDGRGGFTEIFLTGPAQEVFQGTIEL